jgi:hypothetical protein
MALLVLAGCKHDVDWNRKDAWRACAGTIDAWRAGDATPPCNALHVCANEASLDRRQLDTLDRMIAECSPP